MSKNKKKMPHFSSKHEEKIFWETHDSTDYLDWSKSKNTIFPNLKPSSRSTSIRLSESLFETIKMLAHKRGVPYQSLIKIYLTDKVRDDLSRINHK